MNVAGAAAFAAFTVAQLMLSGASSAQTASPTGPIALRGAGATFPAPLYKKWIAAYKSPHANISISYDAVGSGEGIKRFLAESIDFAGSDDGLSESEASKVGRGVTVVPATAGMIVLAYNIPGVDSEIRLPRDVYAAIFAGAIRRWDDPRLTAVNPGVKFPRRDIAIVVRLDSSGTTAAFTRHLASASASWRSGGLGVGKLIAWPSNAMLATGNEGVAARIKISEGAIGYVEYGFAKRLGLRMAALQNKSEAFVPPTEASAQIALSARVVRVNELENPVVDPPATGAYPIVTYSWLFLYRNYSDIAKARTLREFVEWGLTQGQSHGAELGYIPLSADVVSLGKQSLGAGL